MTLLGSRGAQAVADAWNALAGPKYRIDAALVEQNLLDHPLLHPEASGWGEDTFVAVKRSAARLYEGPDPKTAHLSLMGPATSLSRLLPRIADQLRGEGYESLVVGQDSGHFLAGVPTDIPGMGVSLRECGFESGGLSFDLERDLIDLTESPNSLQYACRAARPEDRSALDAFFASEFPGRWRYDVMGQVDTGGPETVMGMFDEAQCVGFALLQTSPARHPIGGAVWRASLGENWGSLGPIGISESLRGSGMGGVFLHRALTELRKRGARRTIIDWTGLVDFYGNQGFSVNRAYRSYRLSLTADQPRAR